MASMEMKTMVDEEINMHEEMRRAFALLSGKWKLEIMWLLNQRVYRFWGTEEGHTRHHPTHADGTTARARSRRSFVPNHLCGGSSTCRI